ncbi:MAG: hypothetical protein AB7V36_11870 [Bacteroidales bacterium]|jgi:hypothetical protein
MIENGFKKTSLSEMRGLLFSRGFAPGKYMQLRHVKRDKFALFVLAAEAVSNDKTHQPLKLDLKLNLGA